ncbi:MAG: DUF2269 domain-containing protein [Corynebacterium casei]|uniref:DUF2269 domain-containing protein n=1 Tax=Corynebacterium casei LMG S-19264 TaxID=1285583 RepID=A0ABN4CDD6_9CORY|nr:hypothetical protein [Corynebacterium casei]AHI20335.1 hypothetical protein CCASEI_08860 [Corynebacterium casei LMG S-19264]MDN5784789.1 DUF2269 domain-containing protein [Corynebacterium casei]MDN5800146.1 DUF2269 domain-containing protein [Corynebacterium casei]MDN5827684.1 DUF2269 domain-containing protein [Corynebacterium casei]MDN5922751.1 DUF2269 domain-containing protein [Corynebacterium casei]
MTSLLIAIHVLAAVLLMGPVMITVSAYQGQMMKAKDGDTKALGAATTLHRLTSQYGPLSAIVPVAGIAVFLTNLSAFGSEGRFHISILLAVIAWVILIAVIIPRQKKTLAALEGGDQVVDFAKEKKQLSMFSGIFNLLWIITALLMFV